jgi:hypothetical protein
VVRHGRPALTLELTEAERRELERLVAAGTTPQRIVARARLILACAGTRSAASVARDLQIPAKRVERWRSRFLRQRLAGLADRPRRGRKAKFGPVTRLQVISLACEPVPVRNGRTRRTIEDIRREAIARAVTPSISWSSVQRILSACDVRPHHVQGWMHSQDPQFREKVTEICDLYVTPPPDAVVICVDEKPGMQALARRFPDQPARPGRRPRREWEYRRHGTQTLIAGFGVHSGEVLATCGDRRTAADLEAFMERVAAKHPTGPVHIVWDNLNIHFDGKDDRWTRFNKRHQQRFVFHYTPKHASWVNQVELFFSILQRECLRGGSFPSIAALRATVLDFIAYWNREVRHPFRWTFTGYPLQAGVDLSRRTA